MNTKTLFISAAAATVLLTGSVTSASAQPYGGSYWGSRPYARTSSTEFYRQLRACQRHDRVHRELGGEHAYEHGTGGIQSRGDHYDQHDSLDEAHDAYHDDHPRADLCDRMSRSSRYRIPYGYWNRTYGNSGYGFDAYGYRNGYRVYGRY